MKIRQKEGVGGALPETVHAPSQQQLHWSHWYWTRDGIFRHQEPNWQLWEECSDCAYLEGELKKLQEIKEEYAQKAASSKGQRKRDFERGVKDKDEQIKYVRQRLKTLECSAKSIETVLPEETAMSESLEVEVVGLEELSESEERDRLHLERRVEKSLAQAEKLLFEAARDLKEIRDRKLFRSTHKTFRDYIQERFTLAKSSAYYQIKAVEVIDNLKIPPMVDILPTSERQVRPLTKLEPDQQREAWQLPVDEAGGKVPSNRIVKDVVQRIKERTPVLNPYQVGEICQIIALVNPELKGKGGCWCIVNEVNEFSLVIAVKGKEYQVKPENLKSTDLNSQQQQEYKKNCVRRDALYSKCASEPSALAFLDEWYYQKRSWSTPLEEKMLRLLESE